MHTLALMRRAAAVSVVVMLAHGQVLAAGFIVTGAGEGGSSHVQVFDATTGQVLFSFFPYDIGFLGGVRVAAADINGDGIADLAVGTGPGGAAHIRVFDGRALLQGQASELLGFLAYHPFFHGGVYIAAAGAAAGTLPPPVVHTIHASAFRGQSTASIFWTAQGSVACTGSCSLRAPVFLPEGATPLHIQLEACDGSATGNVRATFNRVRAPLFSASGTGTVDTGLSATPGCGVFDGGPIGVVGLGDDDVIRNTDQSYFIEVDLTGGSPYFGAVRVFYQPP
jgi:hypothetical protein